MFVHNYARECIVVEVSDVGLNKFHVILDIPEGITV